MPLDPVPQLDEIETVLDDLSSPSTLDVFEAMLTMNPPDPRAYYQIGKTAVLSGKNIDRAEKRRGAVLGGVRRLRIRHDAARSVPMIS